MDYATAKDIVTRAYDSRGDMDSDIYFIYFTDAVARTSATDMRIFDDYYFRVINYSTMGPHKKYCDGVIVKPEVMFLTEQEARQYIILDKLNR